VRVSPPPLAQHISTELKPGISKVPQVYGFLVRVRVRVRVS
jgi:hypothetical protein